MTFMGNASERSTELRHEFLIPRSERENRTGKKVLFVSDHRTCLVRCIELLERNLQKINKKKKEKIIINKKEKEQKKRKEKKRKIEVSHNFSRFNV